MRRISIAAVLAGGVSDIVATNLAMLPVVVGVFASKDIATLSQAQQTALLTEELTSSRALYVTCLVLGSACSVLGGWIAARVAKRDEVLHGTLSALACIGLGIYGWITITADVSPWQHAAFFVLSPVLGALGGLVRARQVVGQTMTQRAAREVGGTHPAASLHRWERVLYVADRLLMGVSAVFAILFVILGAYSRGRGDNAGVIAAIALTVFGVIVMRLYILAGRALVARRRRHWALHIGAFGLTMLPLLLLA
jgi:putative membrane protein (TIGR04086 family)